MYNIHRNPQVSSLVNLSSSYVPTRKDHSLRFSKICRTLSDIFGIAIFENLQTEYRAVFLISNNFDWIFLKYHSIKKVGKRRSFSFAFPA